MFLYTPSLSLSLFSPNPIRLLILVTLICLGTLIDQHTSKTIVQAMNDRKYNASLNLPPQPILGTEKYGIATSQCIVSIQE